MFFKNIEIVVGLRQVQLWIIFSICFFTVFYWITAQEITIISGLSVCTKMAWMWINVTVISISHVYRTIQWKLDQCFLYICFCKLLMHFDAYEWIYVQDEYKHENNHGWIFTRIISIDCQSLLCWLFVMVWLTWLIFVDIDCVCLCLPIAWKTRLIYNII